MYSWNASTMSLRSTEAAYRKEIDLGSSEVLLFSCTQATRAAFPSSFPFSIPLTSDTPQSVQTPHSSLSHTLTATLHPSDHLLPCLSKFITVHTRRYTSHSHSLVLSPETYSLDDPTRVEVEVPRTTFKAGEAIPIYVTVPPPTRELVVDKGLRLRNIRAELVRIIKVGREDDGDISPDLDTDVVEGKANLSDGSLAKTAAPAPTDHPATSSSKVPLSPSFLGSSFRSIIARSGASCRFHSSRPVKLRFVLYQHSPSGSPTDIQVNLPTGEHGQLDSDAECPPITQLTLLHSITFRIYIHISFVDTSSRRERISLLSIPIIILPPPAPLPEVAPQSLDDAYQKKHDRPPTRTVRQDDLDHAAPQYPEGEAGPSALSSSAPPPFEERDAPPPFFAAATAAAASTSTHLPTFLESECEIIVPGPDENTIPAEPATHPPLIVGEGLYFGFLPSQQFDGHSEDMHRSSTPPPTLEMASRDTNLTSLADIREPDRAIEALGLVLDQHEEAVRGEQPPPPPPPAMDDPSDPPPSIDSDFRSPDISRRTPPLPPSPPQRPAYNPVDLPLLQVPSAPPPLHGQSPHRHAAPPPYLVPGNQGDQEHITRPPPYVD